MSDNNHINGQPASLDASLEGSRPRLLRFVQAYGIPADAVDDVVQETLLEAWRHLERFRISESFDAWLMGICRNICLRWRRQQRVALVRLTSLHQQAMGYADDMGYGQTTDIVDPMAIDPAEEVCRQDLAVLLDRAMSHLSEGSRRALEMYYLADIPSDEAAARLGISINTLEVRLHRARQQLRQVLRGELRADADAFGLALDKEMASGWRESREWCFLCGRQRLYGIFEMRADGSVDVRMRCPVCSARNQVDIVTFGGLAKLSKLRSFRPAVKRGTYAIAALCREATKVGHITCPYCQSRASFRGSQQLDFGFPYQKRYCLPLDCPHCGTYILSGVMSAMLAEPVVQDFIAAHPRWVSEPEDLVEHAEQPVIRVRLQDAVSAVRLFLLVHPQTLQVLSTTQE